MITPSHSPFILTSFVIRIFVQHLINLKKVDKNFVEFYDILRLTFENSVKTRHYEKIHTYCKILANSLSIDNIGYRSSVKDSLDIISELIPRDLIVAMEIYEHQKNMLLQFDGDKNTELKFCVEKGK